MLIGPRTTGVIVAAGLAILLHAVPAEAVVHEIVAAWCSGQELEPPGLSEPGTPSFARPVNANGFVGAAVFNPSPGRLPVTFNYDHPASKVEQLTPRVWKTLFAANPLRSDLYECDERRSRQ